MATCDGGTALTRRVEPLRYLAIVAIVISCGSQAVGGQTGQTAPAVSKNAASWTVPRTADGQPDLQGVWNYGTEMPLQRPAELAGKERLTPKEEAEYREQMAARRRERQNGKPTRYSGEVFDDVLAKADWTKRTSLITDPRDGKIPPTTPLAENRRAERAAAFANPDGPEDLGLADRCILGWSTGPPIIPGNQSNVVQLFQSRDHVVIYTEMIHDARIVPLNDRPAVGSTIREYSGVSRGRWEKDTLVVETTNFTRHGIATLTLRQTGGTDENMHLIERFTRTDPKTLLYEFTVTDPTTWTRPWSAAVTMLKTDEHIYEYACHEGNRSLETMLENARATDKAAAGAAKKPPE
jgi:hypothetical protein